MIMKVVLVTGSRRIKPKGLPAQKVMEVLDGWSIDLLIHGAAQGVDTIAEVWANIRSTPTIPMPAKWRDRGRIAGLERNTAMLDILGILRDYGHYCSVVAFPDRDSVGTRNCIKQAFNRGFVVETWEM